LPFISFPSHGGLGGGSDDLRDCNLDKVRLYVLTARLGPQRSQPRLYLLPYWEHLSLPRVLLSPSDSDLWPSLPQGLCSLVSPCPSYPPNFETKREGLLESGKLAGGRLPQKTPEPQLYGLLLYHPSLPRRDSIPSQYLHVSGLWQLCP
jgi:hypothetical protein